jgi:hypothetical protein
MIGAEEASAFLVRVAAIAALFSMKLIPLAGPVQEVLEGALGSSLRPGHALIRLECPAGDPHAYAAVRHPNGRVRALVLAYEQTYLHGQVFLAVEKGVREEENPLAINVSAAFLKCLSPMDLFSVSNGAEAWRKRVGAWLAHQQANKEGEVLLGDYGGPGQYGNDTLGYNPDGKERFRKDALKYLKRVGTHLGWAGKPYFNASGIACSGDATAHFVHPDGTDVYIDISEGSQIPGVRSSVQGVQIMWRFETSDHRNVIGRNQWVHWNTPAGQLAAAIKRLHDTLQPLARAGD